MVSDMGWLQQYIEVGFFADFRTQARRFYERNETSYAFLWFNSIAYANLDFVREVCPEAAQLALLIRAEERLPVREADLPLLDYASISDASRAKAPALSAWPLAEGLVRLRGLARELAVPEEFSVDLVMPYCNEPLDGLLSRSIGYDDEWLSAHVPLSHVNLILYRLEACVPGGSRDVHAFTTLPPSAAASAAHFRSVEVVPVDASPQAWEAARYLMHLASRYDRLADFTLFLHPDVFEHANPRTLRNVLHALRVGTFRKSGLGPIDLAGLGTWYGYLSLSHHYITSPSRMEMPSSNCTDVELAFRDLRSKVFAASAEGDRLDGSEAIGDSDPGEFGFYCCSQFIVHRDRVHQRPQHWYARVADSVPWEHCATSYMELLWHGIFSGGRMHEEKRQERSDLPLILRVDNFIENTAHGLV